MDLQAAEAAILFEGHTEFVCMFGGGSYETVMRELVRSKHAGIECPCAHSCK